MSWPCGFALSESFGSSPYILMELDPPHLLGSLGRCLLPSCPLLRGRVPPRGCFQCCHPGSPPMWDEAAPGRDRASPDQTKSREAAPPCPVGPCRRDPHPLPFHLHDSKCPPSLKPHFSVHDSGLQRSPEGICEGHAVARCGGRAAACGRPSLGPLAASPAALIGEGCSSAAKVPGSNLTNNPFPSPPRAVPLNPVITSAKLPLPCAAPR